MLLFCCVDIDQRPSMDCVYVYTYVHMCKRIFYKWIIFRFDWLSFICFRSEKWWPIQHGEIKKRGHTSTVIKWNGMEWYTMFTLHKFKSADGQSIPILRKNCSFLFSSDPRMFHNEKANFKRSTKIWLNGYVLHRIEIKNWQVQLNFICIQCEYKTNQQTTNNSSKKINDNEYTVLPMTLDN